MSLLKVLCVCEGGNVRSVAAAQILKDEMGLDALACGVSRNTRTTLKMLFNWANVIIILQERLLTHVWNVVGNDCYGKMAILDVGPDRWGSTMGGDGELFGILRLRLLAWREQEFPRGVKRILKT